MSSKREDSFEFLRSRISGCLDGIHGAGSFATSDHNVEHIHPGLVVKNVGHIRLPLSPEDAKALIRVSRQAPAGEGGETLVDETVAKTWEIDAKELSFENEDWTTWLDRVLEYVSEDLGISNDAGSIQAELDKLLVYEESAFFKHHKEYVGVRGLQLEQSLTAVVRRRPITRLEHWSSACPLNMLAAEFA